MERYSRKELRKAIDDLVKKGLLVAVEEINPQTGKPQLRYFDRAAYDEAITKAH